MAKKKVKVIIHETINSRIQQGSIISVSYGYARNYLIPKKIASLATSNILKTSYKVKKVQDQKDQKQYNSMHSMQSLLEQTNTLSLQRKVNQDYRFFGSIVPVTIIQKLFKVTGITVNKKDLDLIPMRKIGVYLIKIHLSSNLVAKINVQVLPVYYM